MRKTHGVQICMLVGLLACGPEAIDSDAGTSTTTATTTPDAGPTTADPPTALTTGTATPTTEPTTDPAPGTGTDTSSSTTLTPTGSTAGDDTGRPDPGCGAADSMWTWESSPGRSIWGSGPGDVWVVGPDPDLARHFDGEQWQAEAIGLADFAANSVTGSGPDDVYIAASDGRVVRREGGAWQLDATLMAEPVLWASGPGQVIAVGAGANFMTRKDGAWQEHPLPDFAALRGLAGSGPADIFAVGDAGVVLHHDGVTFTPITAPTGANLTGVSMLGAGEAIAVGDAGVLLRLTPGDATTIAPLPAPFSEHPLHGVWAAGPDTIFVISVQTLHFFDGEVWTDRSLPFFDAAAAVWGTSADDLYVLGQQHATLHCSA